MNWIGRSLPRLEDPSLLMGRGSYVADRVGKAASVRFVRSPLARGVITDIQIPPGATVFTGRDLTGVQAFIDHYEHTHVPLILSLAPAPDVYKRHYVQRTDELNVQENVELALLYHSLLLG